MQFKNLQKLALHNRLISLSLKGLKPAAAAFTLPNEPVILEISALGAQFVLACADDKALLTLPELKKRAALVKDAALPREILSAFLELYLNPYLKVIGKSLETTLTVTGYGEHFDESRFPISFSFYHELNEVRLPLVFMCRNEDALSNILQKLDEIYFARTAQTADPMEELLPAELKLIAGLSIISAGELASLEEGDALVIDRFLLQDDRLAVGFEGFIATAAISSGKAALASGFIKDTLLHAFLQQDKDSPMSDEKTGDAPASSLKNIDDLKLEVSFIVDRQVMTLASLKELKEGSEIPLANYDLSNVILEVNGRSLASGRIIDLGDRFGFQVLRKGK